MHYSEGQKVDVELMKFFKGLITVLAMLVFALPGMGAISLLTTSLPPASQGVAYSATLGAIGGSTPYSYQVASGILPNGVTLSQAGVLSGTPTAAGNFSFVVRVTDSSNPSETVDTGLVLLVNTANNLRITTATLPQGQVGQGYNATLGATGGAGNYQWDLVGGSGNLPNGLTIAANGTILGTPNIAGSYSFIVRVTDAFGLGETAIANFTIVVNSNVLTIQTTTLPNASVGAFYSQPILVTGGQQPYTISASGSLPPGLSFSNAGVVSGTPTTVGSGTFTVFVTDALSSQKQQTYTLTVGPMVFAINQAALPTGQVGTAYSASLSSVGGAPPYTYTILSGVLPSGISLSAAGVFSGVPTASGSFPITVRVQDNVGAQAVANFTLVINSTTLILSNTGLPNAVINQSYSNSIVASGGQPPYTFSIVAGALPQGLSFGANGTISGTPTASGDFPFTVRVTDASGALTQSIFQLTVSTSSLTLISTALQNGQVNQPYSGNLSATGGTAPYSYSVTGGALPQGLVLGANGLVSGTPTLAGSYQVTFRVQDAAGNSAQSTITIVINTFGFRITTAFLASARLGQPYNANILAEGGATPYIFIFTSGQLPPGLNLGFNGLLQGTPTQAGNYAFTVRALDNAGAATEANFALSVNNNNLTLSNTTLPVAPINVGYSATLVATGGTAPYSFQAVSGGLPPGLNLSPTGVLSGTPVASGTYPFAVQVTDASSATALFNVSVTVSGSAVSITTASLPAGTVGAVYSTTLSASGGSAPYTFALNGGTLPNGLALSGQGTISGTPILNGEFAVTIRVTDSIGGTATASYTITIGGSGTLAITTTNLPSAPLGQPYNAAVVVSGGVLPYSFSIIGGNLPPGISLQANGGLSGTPSAAGTYTFIVRVTDNFGSATQQSLSILVSTGGVVITNTALPNGQLGQFYTTQLNATNGQAPYAWAVISGSLPNGMTLTSNGVLSGVPATGGGFEVTIRAVDSTGQFTTRTFSFVIGSTVLGFLTTSLPQGFINQQYNFQLTVGGGAAPYLFTIVNGTLPNGLSMTNLGQISGTPTATSFASLTFRVTDATGATAQVSLNLAVGQSTLQISTVSIPNAAIGQNYNTVLVATGGTQPYTFTIESGNLPQGLQLSAAGVIAGTANIAGIATFTVRVQDAANAIALQNYSLNVVSSSFQITTTTLPGGRVNQPYLQTIQTVGGVLPIRFEIVATIVAGQPPPGLSLSLQGVLQGTPIATGTYTFTIRAQDQQSLATQATYTIVIGQAAPVITTTALAAGIAGQAYSQVIAATGGTPPYSFAVVGGSVPGLSLSAAGILSGTPNTAGSYTLTVRVTDAVGQNSEATLALTIAGGTTPLAINAFAPPPGVLYFPYSFSLVASGGRQPYAWSIPVGPIPNGLRLDANGSLTGLLLAPGNYRFTVRVRDADGVSADASLGINVANATRLTPGRAGIAYSGQVPQPTAGRAPFTYTLNANALGRLPEGLSLAADGRISGTPVHAGEYTLGLLVRDANGQATNAAISISIAPGTGLRIETPSLPGGATGAAYNQTLRASGGTAPYNWVVTDGSLPNGLNLNPLTGTLSGVPSLQGSNFFVVRVGDAGGATTTAYYGINVGPAGSPAINAVTSAASYGADGVAPGELLTLFGGPLGPQELVSFSLVNGEVPTLLAGTRVLFDGIPAPLIYTQAGQLSVIAPFRLEGQTSTRIVVEYLGFQSTPFTIPVVSSKPALFTVDSSGSGPAAILNENASVNTVANRAGRESVVVLYVTGMGAMSPPGLEGRVAAGVSSLTQPVSVRINGAPATVLYAGNAPGLVEGVVQINVRLPFATTPGQNPVVVQVGPNSTTTNATVWVQ